MPAPVKLRSAVTATGGAGEAELAGPVRALREAGARAELVSIKPGQLQAVRDELRNAGRRGRSGGGVHGNLVTSRQPGDVPALTWEMLTLSAAARGA